MHKQKPIVQLLKDPKISDTRKQNLRLLQEIRQFASQRLKLPNNASYTQFAELNRKAVTWNLVVTGKYSMQPAQWCFPLIGCISYKGYFSKQRENTPAAYAKGKQQRIDIFKKNYQQLKRRWGGDTRYDTWFNQPINNARLILAGVYYQKVPQFIQQLRQYNNDFEQFYRYVERSE